jgi:solute:Na+ symporter, SSS family
MFAATMSSLDTGFNANSAIIVKNIYPDIRDMFNLRELTEKGQLILGQISTVVIGLFVIGIALVFASNENMGIFDILLTLTALISIPLSIPMLMCLFVKKVPAWSALFTVVITFIVSIAGFYSEEIFGEAWSFQKKYLLALVIGCISFILTKLFWKYSNNDYRKKVDEFYEIMNNPVDFEKEVGGSLDNDQFKTLGIFVVALGMFISALLFVPNQFWGRLCIGIVAGFIVAIGLIMYGIGKSLSK